jgi:hypothetical protein
MWGGPPPEQPRGGRAGQSGRYPARPGMPPPGSSGSRWPVGPGGPVSAARPAVGPGQSGSAYRSPGYGPPGYGPPASRTNARIPAAAPQRHHVGFAIFHGGNPGHLWWGEFASILGEAVVAAGVVMWLGYLTYSVKDVTFALIALGLPALLAGPLGAPLTRVEEPAGLFKLVGRVRVGFALALIGMHYLTILPVVYLLLFGLSLCGRLRSALRVAAMRACLAPGEPERVAASTHFGAVVVTIVGPLLAALLFILDGQRILFVSIVAALIFLVGTGSDGLLDALPRTRRAFLLAQPEPAADEDGEAEYDEAEDEEDLDEEEEAEDPEDALLRREAALPEWQQWGPGSISQAVADITAGLRLIGGSDVSTMALRALALLALVGGGLSILEVFYVTDHLLQPTYYLGALLAAEGAGLALGATLWSDLGRRGSGTGALFVGTVGTGLCLAALSMVNVVPQAILVAVGLGAANALAVEGAREALRARFDGVERRALAAAEGTVVALAALAGAGIFFLFIHGLTIPRPGAKGTTAPLTLLAPTTIPQLLFGVGVGLVIAGALFLVLLNTGGFMDRARARREQRREERRAAKAGSGTRGRVPAYLPDLDYDEDLDASGYYPAAGQDDDAYGDDEPWDDDSDGRADSRYARSYGDRGDGRSPRGYGSRGRAGWDDDEPEDDDLDARGRAGGSRGGGRPGPGTPPARGGRGGWR